MERYLQTKKIRLLLEDRCASKVAKLAGLSYQTILKIQKGDEVSLSSIKKLYGYFAEQKQKIDEIMSEGG